jgi:dephospho-CoA kinase
MKKFISLNKSKKFLFFEIPLLVESNLMRKFDIIIFIKSNKSKRLQRFVSKGGNKKLFNMLNKKQLPDFKKIKYCDYVIVNNKDLKFLKKNLSGILRKYE